MGSSQSIQEQSGIKLAMASVILVGGYLGYQYVKESKKKELKRQKLEKLQNKKLRKRQQNQSQISDNQEFQNVENRSGYGNDTDYSPKRSQYQQNYGNLAKSQQDQKLRRPIQEQKQEIAFSYDPQQRLEKLSRVSRTSKNEKLSLQRGEQTYSIAQSSNAPEDIEEDIESIKSDIRLKYDRDRVLSYESIVEILDKRDEILGIKKMKEAFRIKRRQFIDRPHQYKDVITKYVKAIEKRLEKNLNLIANTLQISLKQIEIAQEKHLYGKDLIFILGVKEFLAYQIPIWLTPQKALDIYTELKEAYQMIQNEIALDGVTVYPQLDDEELSIYIKYLALDRLCLKYKIEEEHLKHVIYINYILTNYGQT